MTQSPCPLKKDPPYGLKVAESNPTESIVDALPSALHPDGFAPGEPRNHIGGFGRKPLSHKGYP